MSSLGFKISLIFRVVVSFFHAEAKKIWRIVEKRESHSSTGVTAKKNKKKLLHAFILLFLFFSRSSSFFGYPRKNSFVIHAAAANRRLSSSSSCVSYFNGKSLNRSSLHKTAKPFIIFWFLFVVFITFPYIYEKWYFCLFFGSISHLKRNSASHSKSILCRIVIVMSRRYLCVFLFCFFVFFLLYEMIHDTLTPWGICMCSSSSFFWSSSSVSNSADGSNANDDEGSSQKTLTPVAFYII